MLILFEDFKLILLFPELILLLGDNSIFKLLIFLVELLLGAQLKLKLWLLKPEIFDLSLMRGTLKFMTVSSNFQSYNSDYIIDYFLKLFQFFQIY